MPISTPDRPEQMYRCGRAIDPIFDEEEILYVRCLSDDVQGERLNPAAIKFPDWSVNRSKYSEPEDVLIPNYQEYGVAAFKVKNIPKTLSSPAPGNILSEFKIEHVPEEDNYAHSEVRTYKNGHHDRSIGKKLNSQVKKEFRQLLSDKTFVIRHPLK